MRKTEKTASIFILVLTLLFLSSGDIFAATPLNNVNIELITYGNSGLCLISYDESLGAYAMEQDSPWLKRSSPAFRADDPDNRTMYPTIQGSWSGFDSNWNKPGRHTVVFTSSDSRYSGSKKITYIIIPSSPGDIRTTAKNSTALGKRKVTLSWDPVDDIRTYQIEYVKCSKSVIRRDNGNFNPDFDNKKEHPEYKYGSVLTNSTEYTFSDIDPMTAYKFRIRGIITYATNNAVFGDASYCEYADNTLFVQDFWNFKNMSSVKAKKEYYTDFGIGPARADELLQDKSSNGKGGTCFGMVFTGLSIYQLGGYYAPSVVSYKKGNNLNKVGQNAKSTGTLGNDMTVREYILRGQVYNMSDQMENSRIATWNQLSLIYDTIKERPMLLTIDKINKEGTKGTSAHAIAGLRIHKETKDEVKISVYDPNYPSRVRYLYLEKNGKGNFTGWYYNVSTFEKWKGTCWDSVPLEKRASKTEKGDKNDRLGVFSPLLNQAGGFFLRTSVLKNQALVSVSSDYEKYADDMLSLGNEISMPDGLEERTVHYYNHPYSLYGYYGSILELSGVRKSTALQVISNYSKAGIELGADVKSLSMHVRDSGENEVIINPGKKGTFTVAFMDFKMNSDQAIYTEMEFDVESETKEACIKKSDDGSIIVKGLSSVSVKRTSGKRTEGTWKTKKTVSNSAASLDASNEYRIDSSSKSKPSIKGRNKGTGAYDQPVKTSVPKSSSTKKGDKVYTGNYQYQITKLPAGKTNGTVTLLNVKNKKLKSYTLPATVLIDKKKYTVKTLSSTAFGKCKKATTVSLPKTVVKAGKGAFKGCSKLKKITVPKSELKRMKKMLKKAGVSKKVKIKGR